MLKREIKVNVKGLLIWVLIGVILYGVIYIIYPLIINESNISMYDDMLKMMDPSILKVFNMDISSISHVSGWLYSEGMIILMLFLALYVAILGSTILLKEEDEKTIEYLYSKPISKNKIVTIKMITGIINILVFNIVIFLVNLIGLALSDDLEFTKLLVISMLQWLMAIPLFMISIFISTLFRKTKGCMMICMGFGFFNYFLSVIGLLGEEVEFFKYMSLFTLSSYRDYLISGNISYIAITISLIITITFGYLTYYRYNRKEFL